MLHQVNIPNCKPALDWIVQFQQDLIRALCRDEVTADNVTPEWINNFRDDIPIGWLTKICGWSYEGQPLLDYMRAIAGASLEIKGQIVHYSEICLQFENNFQNDQPNCPIQSIDDFGNSESIQAVKRLLLSLYSRILYDKTGFPIQTNGEIGGRFNYGLFREAFEDSNQHISVCPLCDGGMDGGQVDHWLPKNKFPILSCHPVNLLPICGACNSRTNKGVNTPADKDSPRPFEEWFHPYLRSANGNFSIQFNKGHPILENINALTQTRIDNFDGLINLSKRWAKEYKLIMKGLLKCSRGKMENRQLQAINNQILINWLDEWRNDALLEVGLRPYKILENEMLSVSMNPQSPIFQEVSVYCNEI